MYYRSVFLLQNFKVFVKFIFIISILTLPLFSKGITPLSLGMWSMHTQGKIQVMNYTTPFSKIIKLCIKKNNQKKIILPITKGSCRNSEKIINNIMYYKSICKVDNTYMIYNTTIKTSRKYMKITGKMVKNSYPKTITTYIMTGSYIKASCK